MTDTPPPGPPRAGSTGAGTDGNAARSNRYSAAHSAEDINAYEQELVASPGHGAVGVFQAPQPLRPRSGPAMDASLDIDSPFLDLFGAPAAPPPAQKKKR